MKSIEYAAEALDERRARGKALRNVVPRKMHAHWVVRKARSEVLDRTKASLEGRVPELIPLRNARMAESPFAFYRGGASTMALDLLYAPPTRIAVQLCGDAHVRNLGTFARFDGSIGFDINDFDETLEGPFEWDLKRLAASLVLAGREAEHDDAKCQEAVRLFMATYRERMQELEELPPVERLRRRSTHTEHAHVIEKLLEKAKHKSHADLLSHLTESSAGGLRFKSEPPLLQRRPEELPKFQAALEEYRATIVPSIRLALLGYRLVDVAFKVVGVGSVGLRAYVALLVSGGDRDGLVLQLKQARVSSVAQALGAADLPVPAVTHQGRRIVEGQIAMQSAFDPFLGYTTVNGIEYMVRRLAENKEAIEEKSVENGGLFDYAKSAATVFAYSHGATGDPALISGYLGRSDEMDDAMATFAKAYADQVTDDHANFVASSTTFPRA